MKIKIKYILIILFFVAGILWYINYLNDTIRQKENIILLQQQNEAALKDYINMQADSLQNFSIFVANLQKDNIDLNKKYNLLKSRYTILFDSIKVLNQNAKVDISENIIVVLFEGKKGKVSYKGQTTYFKLTGEGEHSIIISIDSSRVESQIYLDVENNLIKNRIYIDNALVLNAKTEIDSLLYLKIRNNEPKYLYDIGFFDRFHLLFDINQSFKRSNTILLLNKFSINIGLEYQFNKFRIYSKYDYFNSEINTGIQYHVSIKDIWKTIF